MPDLADRGSKDVITTARKQTMDYEKPPKTLKGHMFYGLKLDEEQEAFRDAIWNPEKLIVFCDAKAGTGKTLLAVATADLMCKYHLYDGIVYVVAPVQEGRLGYLPGDASQKISSYCQPFYDACDRLGIDTDRAITSDIMNLKEGTAYIDLVSHNYLRGTNFSRKVVIVDESQNLYTDELKKVLTRVHDDSCCIVIGHSGQCDLLHNPERSGFSAYIEHFRGQPYAEICKLSHNYRGKVSSYADELEIKR